ncbi:hypothetical protein [Shewanella japonica]|uniref:hypothetical protein n=1 Tax=Shewanella japonica TaxID=93973 RepID=UPI0024946855|nr:hypothetical protein [Shewanella japonica]
MFNEISRDKSKSIVGGKMYKITCMGRLKIPGARYGPWMYHTIHSRHFKTSEIKFNGADACKHYFQGTTNSQTNGTGVGQGTARPINGKGGEYVTNKFYF